MIRSVRYANLCLLLLCGSGMTAAWAQTPDRLPFLQPADSFHRGRFWAAAGAGTVLYSGMAYNLYQTWYREYDLTGFHTFNDLGEWQQMDKAGHLFAAHLEANLIYGGARWAGVPPRGAAWTAAGAALWLQTTIEVMDGFSAKWGFSWSDMAFNVAGAGLFLGQQYLWDEQRLLVKISSDLSKTYSKTPLEIPDETTAVSLHTRAVDLFGTSFAERFLKDYNAQTVWLSANIRAFAGPQSRWPGWLNVAVGYGAENMFGGFGNSWTDETSGLRVELAPDRYPRYRQFYLSADIDLSRIKTDSRLLRTVFRCLNYIKIPAPALEINTRGQIKGHWLHW